MINKLKNIKLIKKIFTPGLFLFLLALVGYSVGASLCLLRLKVNFLYGNL